MSRIKQPYLPLYTADILADSKLPNCEPESIAVYFYLLCIFHREEEYGKLTLKAKQKQNAKQNESKIESKSESKIFEFAFALAKRMPFSEGLIANALSDLIEQEVIGLDGDTLFQGRMVRDAEISEKRAIAGSLGGRPSLKKQNAKQNESKSKKQNESKTQSKIKANSEIEIDIDNDIDNINDIEDRDIGVESNRGVGKERDGGEEKETFAPEGQPKRKRTEQEYSPEFEAFWKAYPRKDDKGTAYKKYQARRKDGFSADDLLTAAENYAAQCRKNHTEKDYIKQGKTFLSSTTPFTDYLAAKQNPVEEEDDYRINPFLKYTVPSREEPVETYENPFAQYRR